MAQSKRGERPHGARQHAERELIAAKEALSESNERLQLALDAGHLGDWNWDAATDLLTLGPRAAQMFGLPAGIPVTRARMRELLHPEDSERARKALDQALAERTDYGVEYRVNRPAGGQCWIAASGRGRYAEHGTVLGVTGVMQDISERKRAEEERMQLLDSERAARAAAERTSGMKDEFLAMLSHELRTPLSAILGWAQVLRRRAADDADLRHGIETIERNARVQTQLIEDLLDMSRITSGKVRLDIQPVDPVSFIEAALETVRPAADAKGIRLEKLLDPGAGPISGDPNRLQQVVWNLVSNAIKFTPKDGKVQILLERVNSHIEINVADTGIGIEPEFIAHVFERFRQADASTTRRFGGLGLGLSIVRSLVELHGGTVRVQSPGEGRGATFAVKLPLAVVHRAAHSGERLHPKTPPVNAAAADFRATDLSGIKILVVDDDNDARELVRRVLAEWGAEVFTAGSAAEALLLVEGRRPDVLVSDIGMPDMDGYELLRRVRSLGQARGGRLPAIALTAFARSEDRTRALREGFQVHVSKPVEPAELVATVANVAGRSGEPEAG